MIKDMTRVDFDPLNPNTGAVHSELLSVGDGETSDVYLIPPIQIYAISVNIDGDGILYLTNDPKSVIEEDVVDWVAWDGDSDINLGITAVKLVSTSGDVTCRLTAKTAD